MRTVARILTLAVILLSLSSVAPAYYHWIYYAARTGPFQAVPARFDLGALPNKTVSYFISDQPPGKLMPNDSMDALISQIRLAAQAWNGVGTSDIRLQFGGISNVSTPQSSPGIDVVFDDDMAPGLLAQTRPSMPDDVGDLTKGPGFVPLLRSKLQLRSDLTVYQQASFSDTFFMTIVHEFGHTLGLQHSAASATMSTSITRGTSKGNPLSADDIAGVSTLYPTAAFTAGTGSITGLVTAAPAGGSASGVNMASVVALSTNGTVIGGMTNPDGTYRIDGIPPGAYYVYAHPMPPAQQGESSPAGIVPPTDELGVAFPIDTGFNTLFFPGTQDWTQATQVTVKAAASTDKINFSSQRRTGPAVYDMRLFAYLGPANHVTPVHAPPLVSGYRGWMIFDAAGALVPNTNHLTPGLSINIIGSAAKLESNYLGYFAGDFLDIIGDANKVTVATPVALAVTTNTDLYVLPAAFTVVPTNLPDITSVKSSTDAQGNSSVTITGDNLNATTPILFDGAQASGLQVNKDGTLTVAAPPAAGGHTAALEALTSDGQTTSQLIDPAQPATFTYPSSNAAWITVSPATARAGSDTMILVTGFNTNFIDGQTVIGFGSSDIKVVRTWVVDSTHALLNLSVSPFAATGSVTVSAVTGLQLETLNTVLQVQPVNNSLLTIHTPIVNLANGLAGVPVGGIALIPLNTIPTDLNLWTLTIAGVKTNFNVLKDLTLILAQVPNGTALGPAIVQLSSPSGQQVSAVVLQVDAPPPTVAKVEESGGLVIDGKTVDGPAIDGTHPASPGDTLVVTVSGLADPGIAVPASAVTVIVGSSRYVATSVTVQSDPTVSKIVFVLTNGVAADATQQPLSVQIGTRLSAPYPISITPPPPPPATP